MTTSTDLCDQVFTKLAASEPHQLLKLLEPGRLPNYLLTYAAEAAGDVPEAHQEAARQALALLCTHDSPVVREGAYYGLLKLGSLNVVEAYSLEAARMPASPGLLRVLDDLRAI